MTKALLIEKIARAIAKHEGFYITPEQAEQLGIRWPTLAQRLCNPGNIRRWANRAGIPYPTTHGYVDFLAWARLREPHVSQDEQREIALAEGWRVLRVLIEQYITGRYHNGRSPSLREMFHTYAPASDNNRPDAYAEAVARAVGIAPDTPLMEVIDG